jgi:hypothetical protein
VLAAVQRAALHRPGAGTQVPIHAILDHLEVSRRSATARLVRSRLEGLVEDGALTAARRHGVPAWELTRVGALRVADAVDRGSLPALPEAPQHRLWRRARTAARLEIERFRSTLARDLADARTMLGEGARPDSDAWFELGERLSRDCRLLGSAQHCLHEWREPPDDRADTDEGLEPDEQDLHGFEQARRVARRRGRRNIGLWSRGV